MRTRWRYLFFSSLGALIGVSWLDATLWFNLPMLGMCATAVIAFTAMVNRTRSRTPAAFALLCAAPMIQNVIASLEVLPLLIQYAAFASLLLLAGILGTIASACHLLVVPPPPRPSSPLPRARVA
jgi:hypothetical protein